MSEQPPDGLYQIPPVSVLHWVSWGDEYVVFDEASGQTHLLDPIKAFVLEALSDGPTTAVQFSQPLTTAWPTFRDADRHALVASALEQLQRAQLVEAVLP